MRKIVDYGSIGCDAHGTVKEKKELRLSSALIRFDECCKEKKK